MRQVRPYGFRQRFPQPITGESMTEQSHADLTDVNRIVQRFARTGELPKTNRVPQYADVAQLQSMDYRERIAFADATLSAVSEFLASRPDAPTAAPAAPQSAVPATPTPTPTPST